MTKRGNGSKGRVQLIEHFTIMFSPLNNLLTSILRMKYACTMNARFTMLFKTKTEREKYIRMAKEQEKSLGRVVRDLLEAEYARIESTKQAA